MRSAYGNIRKITNGRGDDYTAGFLLGYPYINKNYHFKENYKLIVTNLSKKLALDGDPRATKQNNFNGNLDRAGNITMFFIDCMLCYYHITYTI